MEKIAEESEREKVSGLQQLQQQQQILVLAICPFGYADVVARPERACVPQVAVAAGEVHVVLLALLVASAHAVAACAPQVVVAAGEGHVAPAHLWVVAASALEVQHSH